MSRIRVLTDAAARPLADVIVDRCRRDGHPVEVRELRCFPTGDGLPATLGFEASLCDVVVVAVAPGSSNRDWVMAELRLSNLYPRILLAVATLSELPSWGEADRRRIRVASDPIPGPITSR